MLVGTSWSRDRATHSGGEPGIVANQRRRAGLPTDRMLLDHERIETFGCAVDSRSEARVGVHR